MTPWIETLDGHECVGARCSCGSELWVVLSDVVSRRVLEAQVRDAMEVHARTCSGVVQRQDPRL